MGSCPIGWFTILKFDLIKNLKANPLLYGPYNNAQNFFDPNRSGKRGTNHAHIFLQFLTGKILKIGNFGMKELI